MQLCRVLKKQNNGLDLSDGKLTQFMNAYDAWYSS